MHISLFLLMLHAVFPASHSSTRLQCSFMVIWSSCILSNMTKLKCHMTFLTSYYIPYKQLLFLAVVLLTWKTTHTHTAFWKGLSVFQRLKQERRGGKKGVLSQFSNSPSKLPEPTHCTSLKHGHKQVPQPPESLVSTNKSQHVLPLHYVLHPLREALKCQLHLNKRMSGP